ncbi:MAG: hypothetical protein HKM00_09610 [Gallionella sp.]|nr:hypothetical protein [Gallionella sp.]
MEIKTANWPFNQKTLDYDDPLAVLRAVAGEISETVRPFSVDSYLPPHICDRVFAAIAKAEKA